MSREVWIALRAFGPAIVPFVMALAFLVPLGATRASPMVAAIFDILRLASLATGVVAAWLIGAAAYRLWRWERGDGPSCIMCDGPLGHERIGRSNRGGAFRRCYACGKAVNNRHYE
jgi:hypothetical protein